MNRLRQRITAGALAFGLMFGCGGCAASPDKPTVHKDSPAPVTADGGPVSPHLLQLANLTAAPQYPDMPQCPRQEDYPEGSQQFYDDQWQWQETLYESRVDSPENAHDLNPFLKSAMETFLSGDGNQVCAPMNIYFALAMLAETTAGNTRQQILDALGQPNMEALRAQANQLWRAHYCNDGQTVSLMANSVWLDEQYSFVDKTLQTLASNHYASVFTGDLGTADMNSQLAQWLDSQTGGLLSEYTQGIELDPRTVFCLASTAYFCADWSDSFSEENTRPEIFHAAQRDVSTDFMHASYLTHTYYEGKDFSAIRLELSGNHRMWLILPDKDSSPGELLEQSDYYALISNPADWAQQECVTLNLSLPIFDVSSEQELIPGLKALGITDVCDPQLANCSPITSEPLFLGQAQHTARVAVDEEGVIAAAYTVMALAGAGMPEKMKEIDFTLNRPFLFAITGQDDLPLFAGIVAEP